MKKLYSLLAFCLVTLIFAQETNVKALNNLKNRFNEQFKQNQSFVKSYAKINGWVSPTYQSKMVGKVGHFLVYMDDLDADQIKVSNTDLLYNNTISGISVTGQGMNVYQWDGGRVLDTHQEFGDRVTNNEADDVDISNHSTAVASIIMGAGVEPLAKGMAYEANLFAYSYANNFTEITNESANNPSYMLSNHSYGYIAGWRYGEFDETIGEKWYWFGYPDIDENESVLHGIYSSLDKNFDDIAFNAPNHLMIKAAGNDRGNGPGGEVEHAVLNSDDEWELVTANRPLNCGETGFDCLPYGGVAKNILLVGSVNQASGNGRYNGPESVVAASYSSFGPTDDGRIKPDIVTQGSSAFVALSNGEYASSNGTSLAAPSITGIATLLQQINNQLKGEYLKASELKALLLNTTNEAGQNPGPDYMFGFGLVDAYKAAKLLVDSENDEAIILSNVLSTEPVSYTITANGNEPVRATLVWIDPSYDASQLPFELNNRTAMLVNDLDLRISKGSDVYMPWTLDVENPAAAAVPGDNVVDNIEQIYIDAPTNDNYTLTVSHKGVLANEQQHFALVISGAKYATQSTKNLNQKAFSIYPNPVKDILKFNGVKQNANVHIFNLEGELMLSEILKNNQLNLSMLNKGIYLIVVKDGENTYTKKLIKE